MARVPTASKFLLSSDAPKHGVPFRFPAVSVFWISHPNNEVTDNIAAGSVGTGFWMSFVPGGVKKRNPQTGVITTVATPISANTLKFDRNIAHSTLVGHTWDGATNTAFTFGSSSASSANVAEGKYVNPNNPMDQLIDSAHYNPSTIPVFSNLIAYKNTQAGIYFRGNSAIFQNAILADNGWSLFLAYNQIIKNSVVIGRSANFGEPERDYLYYKGRLKQRSLGILLYDGPFELHKVDFLNFDTEPVIVDGVDVSTVPFIGSGGSGKFTNLVSGLRFSPEPHHRAFFEHPTGDPDGKAGWMDSHLANNIRDKDGSLTGIADALVLPANNFVNLSGCVDRSFSGKPSFSGFKICPSTIRTATLSIHTPSHPTWVPFVVRRSDGATSLAKEHWGILDSIANQTAVYHNRKFLMITNQNFDYEVIIKNMSLQDRLNVDLTAEYANELSPVIKLMGYGSSCELAGATRVNSLLDLRSSKVDSYFDNGTDFYFRLVASGASTMILKKGSPLVVSTESKSALRTVSCSSPVQSRVHGHIDTVSTNSAGTFVNGWACDFSKDAQIDLKVYLGGAQATGVLVASGKADMTSEAGVSFACGDASMASHRFRIQSPNNILTRYPGETVYVYGVSSSGGQSRDLGRSGIVKLPGVKVSVACSLNGNSVADGSTITSYRSSVVPFEGQCLSEVRKCVAGTLIGSYSNLTCTKNTIPTGDIKGAIEGVVKSGTDYYLNGWACDYGTGLQIPVHFYVGAAAGAGGTIVGSFKATLDATSSPSQETTAVACGDAGGVGMGHRFSYKIPATVLSSHKGKKIYLHGISQIPGKVNKALTGSGSVLLP